MSPLFKQDGSRVAAIAGNSTAMATTETNKAEAECAGMEFPELYTSSPAVKIPINKNGTLAS